MEFGPFLGLSYEGFEEEVVCLFRKIEMRRRGASPNDLRVEKRLKKELKKLESTVNYERKRGEKSARRSRKDRGALILLDGS